MPLNALNAHPMPSHSQIRNPHSSTFILLCRDSPILKRPRALFLSSCPTYSQLAVPGIICLRLGVPNPNNFQSNKVKLRFYLYPPGNYDAALRYNFHFLPIGGIGESESKKGVSTAFGHYFIYFSISDCPALRLVTGVLVPVVGC